MTRLHRRRRQDADWQEEHILALTRGHDWFRAFDADEPRNIPTRQRDGWDEHPATEARLLQAVDEIGDELLAGWIAEQPGSRPWFWWRFVATEPRRCLTGPHRYTRPEYSAVPHRLFFGVPATALPPDWGKGERYETERAYLERLDLLADHERTLLTQPV